MIRELTPMLLSRGDVPLRSPEWVYEVKWDGMRVLVGDGRIVSRHGTDCTQWFPELGEALGRLPPDSVYDGEVVRFVRNQPDFRALLRRIRTRGGRETQALGYAEPCHLIVWDALRLDGQTITELPWHARREALEWSVRPGSRLEISPVESDGEELWRAVERQGLEGIVCKRRDARYLPGERSDAWVKVKRTAESTLAVGGWVETLRGGLSALVVGEWTTEGLQHRGHVGLGLTGEARALLREVLPHLERESCPFVEAPPRRSMWDREPVGPVHWLAPELAVRVRHHAGAINGWLRDPVFLGLAGA